MSFRILTFDGGGARALFQVRTLIHLFGSKKTGHEVLSQFDLVAANSGGSIVLAGLVEDLPLSEIANYFEDATKRRSIFNPTSKISDKILEGFLHFGPKYSENTKLAALQALMPTYGVRPLEGITQGVKGPLGLPVHLLIIALNYDTGRAQFFRSAEASGEDWGQGQPTKATLAEAVHASTNAPVAYFDAPATIPSSADRFWDGGITGCNNPTLAAVIEAIVLGQTPTDVCVLSLGTGAVSLPLAAPGATPSAFESPRPTCTLPGDIQKLATSILADPPDVATFVAHVVTGGKPTTSSALQSRIVRMNPLISPMLDGNGKWIAPPNMPTDVFNYLKGMDMDAVIEYDITLITQYCEAWLGDYAPNQPIRPNGVNGDPSKPEIGYAKFSEAKAAWRALFAPLNAVTS